MNRLSKPHYAEADDEMLSGTVVGDPLVESIIYLCALIPDRPRAIDRYIDYFGETRP